MRFTWLMLAIVLMMGCDPSGVPDGGAPDGGPLDTGFDAPLDAGGRDVAVEVGAIDAPDGGTDAGRATLDDVLGLLCPAIARVRCSAPWDCGCPSFGPRPDEGECRSSEEADCRAAFGETSLGAGIARGAVDTDISELASCLADLEGSYDRCSGRSNDLGERCVHAFVNREAGLGDNCVGALCAGGSGVCSQETGECVPLPGLGMACDLACGDGLRCISDVCAPAADAGESCFSDADCLDDLSCSAGTCRMLGASGSACGEDGACSLGLSCEGGLCTEGPPAECTDETSCASLQRCGFARSEGRCRALIALGEACEVPGSCAAGRCDFATGRCVTSALGDPCSDRADCPAGAVCSFSGICESPGRGGEACVPGFGVTGCEDGLICSGDVCLPLPGPGQPCIDSRCAPGLGCRLEDSGPRCDAPRLTGEACMVSAECGEAGRCVANVCAPRAPVGTSCVFDEECEANLICNAVAGPATCQPRSEIGSLCGGSTCVDGAFCRAEPLPAFCEARVCDHFSFIEL